ncbi:MAG: dual specificity protein phosphatase family protein, partial [Desulfobulbus sp.]
MPEYQLTWITEQLATGYAPMSYEELDFIRDQGITAIVNLCGEFCDLHQIEEKSGFEVYYLPVDDECAPDLDEMEKALEWLDEAVYLKKKVLVQCRHGFGRTGTFVSAYLLRRGLGLKLAEKA